MHICNKKCLAKFKELNPHTVAVYNDDMFIGQNLLITPLIRLIRKRFHINSVDLIVPPEIHHFWRAGKYEVDLICPCNIKYDLVFGVTKRKKFLFCPYKISTKILIAENLKWNLDFWLSNFEADHYFDLLIMAQNDGNEYLASFYLNYMSMWEKIRPEDNSIFFKVRKIAMEKAFEYFSRYRDEGLPMFYLNTDGYSNKTWNTTPKNYVLLAQAITKHVGGIIVLNNSPNKNSIAEWFLSKAKKYNLKALLPPRDDTLGLQFVAALIKNCDTTVTKDSGIYHLSKAVGSRTVVFTKKHSDSELWLKSDDKTVVIMKEREDPSVEEVYNGITQLTKKNCSPPL